MLTKAVLVMKPRAINSRHIEYVYGAKEEGRWVLRVPRENFPTEPAKSLRVTVVVE